MGPSNSLREHGRTEPLCSLNVGAFYQLCQEQDSIVGSYVSCSFCQIRLKFFTNLVHARIFIVIYVPFKHSGYY
jgi:hypothetical protein